MKCQNCEKNEAQGEFHDADTGEVLYLCYECGVHSERHWRGWKKLARIAEHHEVMSVIEKEKTE